MAFAHLHVHTEFSPRDAIATVPAVVRKIAADGQSAVAVTDHGSLGGAWALGQGAAGAGVKPIPGVEAYLALDRVRFGEDGAPLRDADGAPLRTRRTDREVEVVPTGEAAMDAGAGETGGMKERRYHHLTLLAASRAGWRSLIRLHNEAWESHWHTPRIDYELLAEHRDGIIALTGCLGGPVQAPLQTAVHARRALAALDARTDLSDNSRDSLRDAHEEVVAERTAEAERALLRLRDTVNPGHLFVEVMFHGNEGELEVLEELYRLAAKHGLPCVATCDSHCVEAGDEGAQDAWLAIGNGKRLADPHRWRFSGTGYHVKTEAEMRAVFPDDPRWQAACDATQTVADMVAGDVIPPAQMRLPTFRTPVGFASSSAFFEQLVWAGATHRWGTPLPQQHVERLEHEIAVVAAKGFADYFLITRDVIAWCRSDYTPADWAALQDGGAVDASRRERKEPIWVGPGRGSSGGSAAAFCLGITDVDPIAAGLLFERFLAPDRQGMPDIDTDVEEGRRDEVIDFLRTRWGHNKVAQIGTYGMTLPKAALGVFI